jgi:ketosteroid isomerase-like protein
VTPDMESLVAELGDLWRQYGSAFQTGDVDALLPVFAEPCVVQTRDFVAVYNKREDISANNNALLDFYRRQGITKVDLQIAEVDPLHRHFVQMQVRYRLMDTDGNDVVQFTTIYSFKHEGTRWLIHQIIAQNEVDAWAARGTPLGS